MDNLFVFREVILVQIWKCHEMRKFNPYLHNLTFFANDLSARLQRVTIRMSEAYTTLHVTSNYFKLFFYVANLLKRHYSRLNCTFDKMPWECHARLQKVKHPFRQISF